MTQYVSDRQRVESLLLSQMMWAIIEAGAGNREGDEFKQCQKLLVAAMGEPLVGLGERERMKLCRRAGRAHLEVTEPYRTEGARCDKIALIVYFLIKSVTDCDYMVVGEGSNVQRALDFYIPAIEHMVEEPALYRSSKKHSRKVLAHLQRLGYFAGVPFADEDEHEAAEAA